jgi:transcriptional regulator with XRE-family HTH domain
MHMEGRASCSHTSLMGDYKFESLAYLRHLIEVTKKKPTELARLIGVSQTTLTRPLNNRDHKYAVKFQTLQDLSERTGVPLPESLVSARHQGLGKAPEDLRLPIRYEVAAGGFLPRDDLPQQPYGYRTVAAVPPYERDPQWLERVVSDSMNRLIPEGAIIHVVDAKSIRYRATHGDVVVVERAYAQGSLVERTVKQVELTPEGPMLWPRSYNPRWNAAIPLLDGHEDPDVTVEIAARVLRAYTFFTDEPDSDGDTDAP